MSTQVKYSTTRFTLYTNHHLQGEQQGKERVQSGERRRQRGGGGGGVRGDADAGRAAPALRRQGQGRLRRRAGRRFSRQKSLPQGYPKVGLIFAVYSIRDVGKI